MFWLLLYVRFSNIRFYSGAYDSLIGGFIDYGLADLTGMVSEQVVLRKTHLGYHETTGKLLDNDPKRHELPARNQVFGVRCMTSRSTGL